MEMGLQCSQKGNDLNPTHTAAEREAEGRMALARSSAAFSWIQVSRVFQAFLAWLGENESDKYN